MLRKREPLTLLMRVWRVLAIFTLASVVLPLQAGRLSFELVLPDGELLRGGEICFFRSEPGATSPFERWLWSNDVRCFAADEVVAVPRGRWNYFARHEQGWVSAHPLAVVVQGGPETTDTGYKNVRVRVRPAVVADVSALRSALNPGEHVALYFPSTSDSGAHVLPVTSDAQRILIPAGLPFVPLIVSQGTVLRIGELTTIAAGDAPRSIAMIKGRGRALIASVILPKEVKTRTPHSVVPPEITASFGAVEVHRPLTPTTALTEEDFVIFRALPSAAGTMHVRGRFWQSEDRALDTTSGDGVLHALPIVLKAAGALEVTLPTDERAARWYEALTSAPTCAGAPAPNVPVLRVEVRRCRPTSPTQCDEPIAKLLQADQLSRAIRFEGLRPAHYQVAIRRGDRNVFENGVPISAGELTSLAVDLELMTVSGTVRRGNDTARARVVFPSGSVATDAHGRFTTMLPVLREGDLVRIQLCDSGCSFTTEVDASQGMSRELALELPSGELRLRVIDRESRKPLQQAATRVMRIAADGNVALNAPGAATDADGTAAVCSVPLRHPFMLCADANGYDSACTKPLQRSQFDEVTVLELIKTNMLEGRLHAPAPIENGALFFVEPLSGNVTERVRLQSDGAFSTTRKHLPHEVAIFSARNFPLAVIRIPASSQAVLELTMPARPARTFDVRLTEGSASIGLAIGTLTIPAQVFTSHQALQRQQVAASAQRPIRISVVETDPIFVIRGFGPTDRPPDAGSDPFRDPRYAATFPRVAVRAEDTVIVLP